MEKILIIAFLFAGFVSNAQTKIGAALVRNSPTDTYAITFDSLQRGGMHVYTTMANRDALPTGLRSKGMLAAVNDTAVYQLVGGVTNSNWQRVYFITGSGAYVPLSGTVAGSPVTGNLVVNADIILNGATLKYDANRLSNYFGEEAGLNSATNDANAMGFFAGKNSSGGNLNAFGAEAGVNNTAPNVNALGAGAGYNNTFSNVDLFGPLAQADAGKQQVFNNNVANTRWDYNLITANRKIVIPDKSGTLAMLSDISGGMVYTGTTPIIVTGSVISTDTAKTQGKLATFNDILINKNSNIYATDGTLTGPRRMSGNGYVLKLDSTKLAIRDTTAIAGHIYDFNNGVSFVDYNSTNTSSLIQNEVSGVKFSTNDRNNLDTANSVWIKTDRVELNSTNRVDINSKTFYPSTYTTTGTTGNQTINKNSGSVNIAPAITNITVTNNLVTANTIVSARVSTNDATAEILNVVSITNGFIITMSTPATNEAQIKFWITN